MNVSINFFVFYICLLYFQFLFSAVLPFGIPYKLVCFACLLLSVFCIKNVRLSKGLYLWLGCFVIINFQGFFLLTLETWLSGYTRTIMYLLFKIPEIALICVFVSSHNIKNLEVVLHRVRQYFVATGFVLFVYFLLVYFNILPYIHRFIVFNGDRFGGFVGEPRDFGLLAFIFLLSTYSFPSNRNTIERALLFIFVISSGSNAVVILLLGLAWFYFFQRKPFLVLTTSIVSIISLYSFILVLDVNFGRFDLDVPELHAIVSSFDPSDPPPGLNPITVRFFNFIFNIHWMLDNWLSYGIGSSMDIAYNEQLFDYNVYESSTGLFGFTMIGVELGVLGLLLVLANSIYYLLKISADRDKAFLSFAILLVILLLSSPYSSLYFFLLIYIYKSIKTKGSLGIL